MANMARNFHVNDFGILSRSCARKIMKIRKSYGKKISGTFFLDTVYNARQIWSKDENTQFWWNEEAATYSKTQTASMKVAC